MKIIIDWLIPMKTINSFQINPLDVTFEPLAGSTLTNILRLIAQNHGRVEFIGFARIVYSLMMGTVLSPLNILERLKFDKKVLNKSIDHPPIFIIGHWRTGSTYLHNLICQDTQFGYPSTFQTVTPAVILGFEKMIKPIVSSSLPDKRPQDDVDMGADLPQEEEYALGNLSPYSFYNGWLFPKNMDLYNNYVDFKNVKEREIQEFKNIFLYYVQKLNYYYHGKQLVLKNPSNTCRIRELLDIFPDAKFIHIYRNPYHVYLSMKRNIEKEMPLYTLQKPPAWDVFEKAMVDMYLRMFEKYFKEKPLILKENFTEIKYEDFIQHPVDEMKRMYKELSLPGFSEAQPRFQRYVDSQKKIKISSYKIKQDLKNKIYGYLHETIDLWGYDI